ncbi:MAG: hypothetical protein AAF849_04890 [Bacteroidota bacterium]
MSVYSVNPLIEFALPIADKVSVENDELVEEEQPTFEIIAHTLIYEVIPNFENWFVPDTTCSESKKLGLKAIKRIFSKHNKTLVEVNIPFASYLSDELEELKLCF